MDFQTEAWPYIERYGLPLLLALITLIVGNYAIKIIVRLFQKGMKKREVEESLQTFLSSLVKFVLKACLVFSVISMVGVETTSFVAILAAMGLAIGLALQGTLGNFAGGVMILLFKPFKVDDYIEAQGHDGTVKEIQIFYTVLNTPDNKVIVIPNGPLFTNPIVNYTANEVRRLDLTIGIGYGESTKYAMDVFRDIVEKHDLVLKDPAPMIVVKEHADSSVNIGVRPWTKTEDYWTVHFDLLQSIYERIEEDDKLSIPYPQIDLHMDKLNEQPA